MSISPHIISELCFVVARSTASCQYPRSRSTPTHLALAATGESDNDESLLMLSSQVRELSSQVTELSLQLRELLL